MDMEASGDEGELAGVPKTVLTDLQTTCQKTVLVALVLDTGETVYVSGEIVNSAIDPQLSEAIQRAPGTGTVIVRARQTTR